MAQYLTHVLLAIDQLGTTIVGGWPNENLSSYAYRMEQQDKPWGKFWRPKIDFMFSWQNDPHGHCHDSYLNVLKRMGLPPEIRNLYHTD